MSKVLQKQVYLIQNKEYNESTFEAETIIMPLMQVGNGIKASFGSWSAHSDFPEHELERFRILRDNRRRLRMKWIMTGLLCLSVAGIGFGVYYFFFYEAPPPENIATMESDVLIFKVEEMPLNTVAFIDSDSIVVDKERHIWVNANARTDTENDRRYSYQVTRLRDGYKLTYIGEGKPVFHLEERSSGLLPVILFEVGK